jgi:Mrp family chromosome partitioning ATPase
MSERPDEHALAPVGTPRPVAGLLAVRQGQALLPAPRVEPTTADAYLRLAAQLLLAADRDRVRSVGVTSAGRGEGKTTAALNLAMCLGRARGRQGGVLLVDGDVHQRSLTRLVLGAAADATGADQPTLFTTPFQGVDLMIAPDLGDELALYTPQAWRRLLADVSMRYEHVIVDCPSVLDHPAGRLMRDCVEGLVLVVRAGHTPRQRVQEALAGAQRRVIGVVLNGSQGRAA